MNKTSNRLSLSRRVLKAVSSIKAMLFRRLFRSSVYESVRPNASSRLGWLETLASLIGKNSQDLHRGGVLKVSAKERAKRSSAREFRRRFVMAEQLELRALMAADLGLDPAFSQQPVAAEVGAMVPGQVSTPIASAAEVVFVDPGVTDPQDLMQGLRTGVEFVMLDGLQDGVAQIAAYLEGKSGIQAIHLVGHGRSGGIFLGSSVLGNGTLDGYSTALAKIGGALTSDGDILVYGCETAEGAQGQHFLQQLARMTSADVAGSSDITGASSLGGDWDLEVVIGDVKASVFSSEDQLSKYDGVLGAPVAGATFPASFAGATLVIPAGSISVSSWNTESGQAQNMSFQIQAFVNGSATSTGSFTVSGTGGSVTVTNTANSGTLIFGRGGSGNNATARETAANNLNAALAGRTITYALPLAGANATTIRFKLSAIDGGGTGTIDVTVNQVAAPVVTVGNATNPVFTEDQPAVAVAASSTVTDTDSTNLESMTITLTSRPDGDLESLSYTSAGGIAGSYNSTDGSLVLTGTTTLANYESVLRSLRYNNTSQNPNTSNRLISILANDGANASSVVTATVGVVAVNDAPVMTSGGSLAYTEGGSAAVIHGALTVADVDNTSLRGATVTISSGLTAGDVLGFVSQNGITGTYNSTTGVLNLSGTASVANYQTALRTVTYRSTSPDPTGISATRTISWQVSDGGLESTAVTSTVNITPILSAPSVDLNGGLAGTDTLVAYTQGTPVALAIGGLVTDSDGGDGMARLVVALSNPQSGDVLSMAPVAGLESTYASGVLTITPVSPATTASLASFQEALRSVTFDNTSLNPSLDERVINVQATDAGSLSGNVAVAKVSMSGVNDAPVYQTGTLVDQTPVKGLPFSYNPSNDLTTSLFIDPENDSLKYSAFRVDGGTLSPLPSWLTFNPTSLKFYGVAPDTTSFTVRLVATDTSGASGFGEFSVSASETLEGTQIVSVGFPKAYMLTNEAAHSTSNPPKYQLETNSFTTESGPIAGTNFVLYQSSFGGAYTGDFQGNNVVGVLTYINANGDVVSIGGEASRPVKTTGNVIRGFYMWANKNTPETTDDNGILLVIDENYFANSATYNSSSDRVDSDLNAYKNQAVLSIASARANESTGTISFVITRSGDGTPSVRYTTSIGLADSASGSDFISKTEVVTFGQNETSKTVTVSLVNDNLYELDETFSVTLSDAVDARLGVAEAQGTIVDDDPAPTVSIANSGNIEGNAIIFTVTRTGNSQEVQTVRYATALASTGSVASPDDFVSNSGTLTFNPGETTKTFTVQTVQDSLLESDETFLVNLSSPTGGLTISTAQATGTIKDDESTVYYYVESAQATEGSGVQFVIRRTGIVQNIDFNDPNFADAGQSITYWTSIRGSDNSEIADFTGISSASPASVTFLASETAVTVTIDTANDSIYEGDETFGLFLGEPAALLAGNSTDTATSPFGNEATGTILDNELPPKFTVAVGNPSSVTEGGSIDFIITRDADAEGPQSVDYSTVIRSSDNAAVNDFTPVSGTQIFLPGELSKTITVATILDDVAEGDETFGFAISNPTGGAELGASTQATGTLIDANTAPVAGNTTVGTEARPALEDTPYVFGEFDFGYTDAENAPLWSIQIKSLPSSGVLQKATTSTPDGNGGATLGGWTDVVVNEVLTISGPTGIGAGGFRYVPAANANANNLDPDPTFAIRVSDGANFSPDVLANFGTVTINITPVNDAPEGNEVVPNLNAYVGGFITISDSDFGFRELIDVPSDSFHAVKFFNVPERPVQGSVANEGAVQTQVGGFSNSRSGTITGARDIRTSAFSQAITANNPQFVNAETGSWPIVGQGTFTKRLAGRYGVMYLNPAADNNSPGSYYFEPYTDGQGGYTYVASYDTTTSPFSPEYQPLSIPDGVKVTDGFLFDVGADGTDFLRKTLTFTLTGNSGSASGFDFESSVWNTVKDGDVVHVSEIVANRLRYSPCFCGVARFKTDGTFQIGTNGGAVFTTLKYQVQDNGGTANGGVDLDQSPNDITITLIDGFSPVINVPSERYFNEDSTLSFGGFGQENALYVTYNPPGVAPEDINEITVVVELSSDSRPGTLSLDGGLPASGVTATTVNGKVTKYEIVGTTAFANTVLANLNFTPDVDQFSTTDLGEDAGDPRYPGLNGIGGSDTYAILRVSARNNPLFGETQYPTTRAGVDMSVLNVNDAPVASGSASLPDVLEDAIAPVGSTVTSLFTGNFSDIKDSSPNTNYVTSQTLAGVAIRDYSPDATKGAWEYSADGTSWTAVPSRTADDVNAFALPASSQLRFVPAANYNGSAPTLTVRLIESSSTAVTVGSLDVSVNGDTTRFSSGTVVLSATVTAVNDIPVSVGATPASVSALEESAITTAQLLGLGGLDYTPGVPSDESSQTLTYIIRTIPSFIELYKADGTTRVNSDDELTIEELRGLKYKTPVDAAGSGTLTWDVKDSGGTENGGVDTLPQSLSITITGVNDAPVFTGTTASISTSEDASNSTAASAALGGLSYGPGGGLDESGQALAVTITGVPGLVSLFKADGTTPVTVGTVLTVEELQGLTIKTVANLNGVGVITYTVSDDGGTANGGSDTLSQSISVTVTAVNDAPLASGAATLSPVLEDSSEPVGDTVSNLFLPSFDDGVDQVTGGSDANGFAGIAITGYNAVASRGRWEYNNGAGWTTLAGVSGSTSATVIPAGSSLRFVPTTNFNGQAPTITALLIDDSSGSVSFATGVNLGTTGGTTQYSSASVVLSHTVTAVNDAPVASGSASLPAILEGNLEPSGATVASLFNLNFSDATDNVTGGSTANTLAGVAIRSYVEDTSKGRWQYSTNNGSSWSNVAPIDPASDIAAFALKRTDLLRFKPANDDYNSTDGGAVPALVARLIDTSFGTLATGGLNVSSNGGTSPVSSGLVTLTASVTSVNDAPVSADQTVTVIEDTTYTLTKANFGFGTGFDDPKDTPDNSFVKVIITSLPASGTLLLNGSSVQADDTISVRDIEEGKLTYAPAENVNGANSASVGFKVQDNGGVSNGGVDTSVATYTVTIDITPVNDAPTSGPTTVSTDEDTPYAFSSGVFPFADAIDSPANSLQSVVITSLPAVGTLTLSGTDVTVGQVIPLASIGSLVFTPNANTSGTNYAQVGFKVQDDGGMADGGLDTSVSSYTVTINVNPVNDQPVATGNATLSSVFKNAPNSDGVTVSSLFGSLYSDPNDQPNPNTFTGVAITGLAHDVAKGTWQYQPAAGGDWVSLGSISSDASVTLQSTDRLRFMPANDYVGAASELTVRLVENVTPVTGDTVDLSGVLAVTSNYSSNTSTLSHEIKGGLLVKGLADVSEGSAAVFTVSFDAVTSADVTLTLSDVTTEPGDYVVEFNNTTNWDSSKVNVYYFDGSTRVVMPVNVSNQVAVVSLGEFYVSVPTVNNSIYEGPESLRLSASMIGSDSSDISTVLDNGFGVVYKDDATPESSFTADNDLIVDVTSYTPVNEGSDYAFFSVEGSSGDTLRLAVVNGTATLVSPRIEYAVVSTTTGSAQWTQYDGAANSPLVPGGLGSGTGVVYVRVSIASEQDDTYEASETFSLTATSVTNPVKSDLDTTEIVDAGNGLKYGPNISGGAPESSSSDLDDDRGLSVTSYAPVNEGSTYHMFKVVGPTGLVLNLGLEDPVSGRAATSNAFTFEYSTDKTTWTTYTWNGSSGNRPTVPVGVNNGTGEVYVRVNITSEMDTSLDPADWFEGSEKFQLRAETLAGKVALGTGEILDDGLGELYTGAWGTNDPTTTTGGLEDDRVWAINDHVDSIVLATVTINARSNDRAVDGVTISDEIDLDPSTPDVVDTQRVVSGQGTWRVVNGNVTYSPLTTFRADPTPIHYAIRPTDRTNFSKGTATIGIDFPVGTSPDGNVPVATGTPVTLDVLTNDTFGDTPVASTLRFASTGNREPLVVAGQGTWTIDETTNAITFTPEENVTRDPDPIRYLVNDEDGNVSPATLVTVTYLRDSRFVVQVNDSYLSNPTGFDVVIVDNVTASGLGIPIDLGNGITVTPNTADMDLTVGRIVWSGAVGGFSRVQIDARSKPVLTGTTADISLVTSVTSRAAGNIEVRASDMSYSLNAGTYTLASPISGTNNGNVRFSEAVGLSNEPMTTAADLASASSVFNSSNTQFSSGMTNRSLSWTGARTFTLSQPTIVSLGKAVRVVHGRSTRTTQLTAGGKLVETSEPVDLAPYTDWVLSGSMGLSAMASPAFRAEPVMAGLELTPELRPISVGESLPNSEFFAVLDLGTQDTLIESPMPVELDSEVEEAANGLRRSIVRGFFKRG